MFSLKGVRAKISALYMRAESILDELAGMVAADGHGQKWYFWSSPMAWMFRTIRIRSV